MLALLERETPGVCVLADDIGASAGSLAKVFRVTVQTARNWLKTGKAPRAVELALFAISRWGASEKECEQANALNTWRSLAQALQREKQEKQAAKQPACRTRSCWFVPEGGSRIRHPRPEALRLAWGHAPIPRNRAPIGPDACREASRLQKVLSHPRREGSRVERLFEVVWSPARRSPSYSPG